MTILTPYAVLVLCSTLFQPQLKFYFYFVSLSLNLYCTLCLNITIFKGTKDTYKVKEKQMFTLDLPSQFFPTAVRPNCHSVCSFYIIHSPTPGAILAHSELDYIGYIDFLMFVAECSLKKKKINDH